MSKSKDIFKEGTIDLAEVDRLIKEHGEKVDLQWKLKEYKRYADKWKMLQAYLAGNDGLPKEEWVGGRIKTNKTERTREERGNSIRKTVQEIQRQCMAEFVLKATAEGVTKRVDE